jgi:hypothetical protein
MHFRSKKEPRLDPSEFAQELADIRARRRIEYRAKKQRLPLTGGQVAIALAEVTRLPVARIAMFLACRVPSEHGLSLDKVEQLAQAAEAMFTV